MVGIYFQQGDLHVSIEYDFGGEGAPRCIALHSFKGSLNGTPLEVTSPGRRIDDGHPEPTCEFPHLKLSAAQFPPGIAANIRISDDSMEIKVDLPTLFVARTTLVVSGTPGQMYPGEEVVVSWTPETDLILLGSPLCIFSGDTTGEIFRSAPTLTPADCRYGVCDGQISLIDPQHVWLRVPTPSPASGPLPITGTLSLCCFSMAIDRCDGAKCSVPAYHRAQMTMVAAP
jgi:hypothetical protein